jgi:DNA-binding PadR family transcriptional regulator
MILLAILKHGPDATAGDVQAALSEARGSEQPFGSVFTTLDRLEQKKFVKWKKGKPDTRRGGRAPRLYTVTGAGQATLITSLRATHALAEGAIAIGPALPSGTRA